MDLGEKLRVCDHGFCLLVKLLCLPDHLLILLDHLGGLHFPLVHGLQMMLNLLPVILDPVSSSCVVEHRHSGLNGNRLRYIAQCENCQNRK